MIEKKSKIYLFYKSHDGSNTLALKLNSGNNYLVSTIVAHENFYYDLESLIKPYDICIFTHGIPRGRKKRGLWINAWHGFPLKNMGLCDANKSQRNLTKKTPWHLFDYWLSYGMEYEKRMQAMIGINEKKFIRTGIPRLDFIKQEKNAAKRILICPTFRTSNYRTDGNLRKLSEFYKKLTLTYESYAEKKVSFYLKAHPNEIGFFESMIRDCNIRLFSPKSGDFYQYLHNFSTVITDYSSLWVDLLHTDTNIVFALPDHTEYLESRGLYSDNYINDLPGPVLLNEGDLVKLSRYDLGQPNQTKNGYTTNWIELSYEGSRRTWDFLMNRMH